MSIYHDRWGDVKSQCPIFCHGYYTSKLCSIFERSTQRQCVVVRYVRDYAFLKSHIHPNSATISSRTIASPSPQGDMSIVRIRAPARYALACVRAMCVSHLIVDDSGDKNCHFLPYFVMVVHFCTYLSR